MADRNELDEHGVIVSDVFFETSDAEISVYVSYPKFRRDVIAIRDAVANGDIILTDTRFASDTVAKRLREEVRSVGGKLTRVVDEQLFAAKPALTSSVPSEDRSTETEVYGSSTNVYTPPEADSEHSASVEDDGDEKSVDTSWITFCPDCGADISAYDRVPTYCPQCGDAIRPADR